ncbi:quinone-dependent dihydroorotate dehydrogenase [Balneola sp. MJW-20]|uniref:quinone-dependent dihydroorotate dehydrogenase n=1 Tax=Gracilimonas aurantiaca TaxID=3234185 RepID=UPI00346778BA
MIYKNLVRPLLFNMDAEEAHDLSLEIAHLTNENDFLQFLSSLIYGLDDPSLKRNLMGLTFPNPVGLAAGYDKNGITPYAMQALGFGFVEIGSITAQPSEGNPKPRAFRLPEDESLINRMGLNNQGAAAIVDRLKNYDLDIPLGVNIAKTNDASIHGDDAIQDYVFSYNKALKTADYITINISCPNTGEGKTFEDPGALKDLLDAVNPSQNETPTLVKFSVDTPKQILEDLITICEDHDLDGYVATNTSSKRIGLKTSPAAVREIGNGGLSGAAIEEASTNMISWIRESVPSDRVIIGVGGIHDEDSARKKIDAGADLLQIYTALVYEGPGLVRRIKSSLLS